MNSFIPSQIKSFISENRTSDALALLLEASRPNKQVHYAVQIVLGQFNDLTSQRVRGTIDDIEATKSLNLIHDKILLAMNSFDSEGNLLPNSTVHTSGRISRFLLRLGLLVFGIALLLMVLGIVLKLRSSTAASYVEAASLGLWLAGFLMMGCWLVSLALKPLKWRRMTMDGVKGDINT